MRVAYGIDLTESQNKEYFHMIESIGAVGEIISAPGNFPVEAIHALRYLPEWAPGGGFKKFAAEAKTFFGATVNRLYQAAVEGIVGSFPFMDIAAFSHGYICSSTRASVANRSSLGH